MSAPDQFRIARAGWVRPLLVLFTATDSRSRIELRPDALHVRYGWHTLDVPYDRISSAGPARWPWYAGIGWRTNFRSVLGLVGSYSGVIRVDLDPPIRTRLLGIPFGVRQLYVSLEAPSAFLEALGARTGTARIGNDASSQ